MQRKKDAACYSRYSGAVTLKELMPTWWGNERFVEAKRD